MYSKGISWIDDCRIPFVDGDTTNAGKRTCNIFEKEYQSGGNGSPDYITDTRGRFPANLLVSDDMLNDGKKYGNLFNTNRNKDVDGGTGNSLVRAHKQGESNGVFDNGISSSRFYDIDKWFDNLIDV
jgi:hypothetical protein